MVARSPATAVAIQGLRVDIGHTPVFRDAPALDGVKVINRSKWPIRTTDRDEPRKRRLDVTGFVSAAAPSVAPVP